MHGYRTEGRKHSKTGTINYSPFLFKDLSHLETRSEEVLLKENVLIQVKTFSVNFHSTLLLFS